MWPISCAKYLLTLLHWNPLQTHVFYIGYEVLTAVDTKNAVIWDIRVMPWSLLKLNWRVRGIYRILLQGRITWARYQCEREWQAEVSCLAHSTLKMEIMYFPETPIDFQRATHCYVWEDSRLCVFYFLTIVNSMAELRTCDMGAALVPLNLALEAT
jgi:hypothetical protein